MKNSKIKIIWNKIIRFTIVTILIILSLYNVIYTIGKEYNEKFNVKIFGFQFGVVTVDAMHPEIKKNDTVIYKQAEEGQLSENDIVVLYRNDRLIVRRIILKKQNGSQISYVTKGDKYLYNDSIEVEVYDIEGKVEKIIPKSGTFFKIIQSKVLTGFITIFLILVFMNNKRKIEKSKYRRQIKQQKKTS